MLGLKKLFERIFYQPSEKKIKKRLHEWEQAKNCLLLLRTFRSSREEFQVFAVMNTEYGPHRLALESKIFMAKEQAMTDFYMKYVEPQYHFENLLINAQTIINIANQCKT